MEGNGSKRTDKYIAFIQHTPNGSGVRWKEHSIRFHLSSVCGWDRHMESASTERIRMASALTEVARLHDEHYWLDSNFNPEMHSSISRVNERANTHTDRQTAHSVVFFAVLFTSFFYFSSARRTACRVEYSVAILIHRGARALALERRCCALRLIFSLVLETNGFLSHLNHFYCFSILFFILHSLAHSFMWSRCVAPFPFNALCVYLFSCDSLSPSISECSFRLGKQWRFGEKLIM